MYSIFLLNQLIRNRILFVFLIITQFVIAQNQGPRHDMMNFVPGKIIVKLKDNVNAKVSYTSKGVGTTAENIGKLLGIEKKVSGTNVMFSQQSVEKSTMRKQSGYKDSRLKEVHSLKNTFVLNLKDVQENVLSLAEDLKKNPVVEYAEPDYMFSINDFSIDSKIFTEADLKNHKNSTSIVAPNDPLYNQQSNITATQINKVWDTYGTGNGSQTIAILDTGVDYNHPDLQPNIWTNTKELNGIAGFDDDGNGFIDDIRGWDFINLDNAPLDDNMHGTHVAGIAGAIGGNSLGIAGAVWNVKLMPLKVFQSNGVGNASTIALAIQYASNHGATIINMSFGSYAESMTMRNALENAYATSVLVAAAGNDGFAIGPCATCAPFYPAAYTYVIGIQDSAKYSNFDQDGPIFSGYSNFLNYELKAPGSGIMSTVPNGGYRSLTGTSMATPLVSGGVALYLQQKPNESKELLFGNLINTSESFVNFKAALEISPTPLLKILSAIIKDNSIGQNGNGYFEPNEIIDIFPLIKNYWGPTTDVRVGIEFAEFEDTSKATILKSEIAIGSINEYANLQDLTKSLQIKIASNVANNVNIKFLLKVWSGPNKEYLTSNEYNIKATNAIILDDYITSNMTLKEDQYYIFEGNMILTNGITLTIEPGVTIGMGEQRKIYVDGNSKIIANGTREKPIVIKPGTNVNEWAGVIVNSGSAVFNYTNFKNLFKILYDKPMFTGGVYNNCLFYDMNITGADFSQSAIFNKSNFFESFFRWGTLDGQHNYSNMSNMYYKHDHGYAYSDGPAKRTYNYNSSNVINYLCDSSKDYQSKEHPLLKSSGNMTGILSLPKSVYFGSSSKEKLKNYFTDYKNDNTLTAKFEYDDLKLLPFAEAHGIVWKVLVNGKDGQDEYELMDPIGVGTHKFDIYFNRAMDKTRPPQISYGVREPYTQKNISEVGTWSADGKIYSVTHEVKIGAADGVNRIRVQGARDLDYFEIPTEDSRFNMLVQSAGSASVGFGATPGLGKIALDWEIPSGTVLGDVLGYNMYRYKSNSNGTFTDPIKVNQTLIATPTYTDYDVAEAQTYFYKYKILRTNLEETDYSITVAASPLTSKLGDSNGDFSVNVMDLVQSVDYILGNKPTPFILKAADVNNDQSINVLDIVGTVDIILNPRVGSIASNNNDIAFYPKKAVGDATFYWEGNNLFVESEHPIGGLQLAFNTDFDYTKSEAIKSFEELSYKQDDQKVVMMYSFNGTSLPAGKTKLLTKNTPVLGLLDISKAVVGMPNGSKLNAIYKNTSVPSIIAPIQTNFSVITSFYPNPTNGNVTVEYYLPEKMDTVSFSVFDLQGKRVWNQNNYKNTSGFSSAELELNSLSNNIYFLVMDVERNGELKDRIVKKLIIKK